MSDHKDWTSIQIVGPLPMGIAGALMQLIGAAWPESMIESNSRLALDMRVPNKPAQSVDEEFIDQIRKGAEGEGHDASFLGFRDGWVAFAPPEELCLELGQVAHAIFTAHQDAINHVEWVVTTGKEADAPRYVLSVSKSEGQTPLAMRKEAEAEVVRLKHHEIENERLWALLEEHGIDPEGGQ